MPTDCDHLTRELAALMQAHNQWTARVERLRRTAQQLERSSDLETLLDAVTDLDEQLGRTMAELQEARALAAEWEQKARTLSQTLYKERSEKARRIRGLQDELAQMRFAHGTLLQS